MLRIRPTSSLFRDNYFTYDTRCKRYARIISTREISDFVLRRGKGCLISFPVFPGYRTIHASLSALYRTLAKSARQLYALLAMGKVPCQCLVTPKITRISGFTIAIRSIRDLINRRSRHVHIVTSRPSFGNNVCDEERLRRRNANSNVKVINLRMNVGVLFLLLNVFTIHCFRRSVNRIEFKTSKDKNRVMARQYTTRYSKCPFRFQLLRRVHFRLFRFNFCFTSTMPIQVRCVYPGMKLIREERRILKRRSRSSRKRSRRYYGTSGNRHLLTCRYTRSKNRFVMRELIM